MTNSVDLIVGNLRYADWKSVRVTRSIETPTGSFALDVSDRWGDEEARPIAEEDACRVEVAGVPVIDGFIDKRSQSATKDARTLTYSGRDRTAALVDCSAVLPKWTFRKVNLVAFAKTIAAPFGIRVTVQPGLDLREVPKVVISPGDSCYEAIKRVAEMQGVLLVSDGVGGLHITRAGTARASSLIEGENILSCSVEYDGTERFRRYVIFTQVAGTDEASGNATRIRAEATDEGVQRAERVLVIRPDKGLDTELARRRADWEARSRAARAEAVTITVQGWKQADGELWTVNQRSHVHAPRCLNVDGDMLISQVEYSLGDGGQLATLRLVRPDAFTPEPKAKVKAGGDRGWWKKGTDFGS